MTSGNRKIILRHAVPTALLSSTSIHDSGHKTEDRNIQFATDDYIVLTLKLKNRFENVNVTAILNSFVSISHLANTLHFRIFKFCM